MPLFKTGQRLVKGGIVGMLLGTMFNVHVLPHSSHPELLLNL